MTYLLFLYAFSVNFYGKVSFVSMIKMSSTIILTIVLSVLVAYELGILEINIDYIYNKINIIDVFSINKSVTTDSWVKLFFSIIPDYIISRLLIKDIEKKHKLNLLKKVWNWVELKKILVKTIIFFLIIFIIRMILRHNITWYFFGNQDFISVFLAICWLLPFINYISNLSLKYIINKEISAKDFYLFNENVVKSTNFYVVIFILLSLYLNMFYLLPIMGGFLYEINKLITPSTILSEIKQSPFLDKILFEIKKSRFPSTACFILPPQDGWEVFTTENGSVYVKVIEDVVYRTFGLFNELMHPKVRSYSACYGVPVYSNNYGHTYVSTRSNCTVFNAILHHEFNTGRHFLTHTVHITDKYKNFSIATVVTEDSYRNKRLLVGIYDPQLPVPDIKNWMTFSSNDINAVKAVLQNVESLGVTLKKYDTMDFKSVTILTPFLADLRFSTNNSKYYHFDNSAYAKRAYETESFLIKKDNYTGIKNIGFSLTKPDNFEVAFNGECQKSFRLKQRFLNNIVQKTSNVNDYIEEIYFGNAIFSGVIQSNESKYSIYVVDKEDSDLPWVHSIIDPNNIQGAIYEIDRRLGLSLEGRSRNINNINIYTQGEIFSEDDKLYKVPMISNSFYLNIQDDTILHLPYAEFLTSSTYFIDENMNNNNFFNTLKGIVSYLYNYEDVEYNSEMNRNLMANIFKKELIDSIFNDIINNPVYKYFYPNFEIHGNSSYISMFRSSRAHDWTVFCISNRNLFEGFKHITNNQINIPSYIDPNIKKNLTKFLYDRKFIIQDNDYNCQHENLRLNIMFLDNFCVEFAIGHSWCSSANCMRSSFNNSPDMYSIMFKDKKILNLLDIDDQKDFLNYLDKIHPSSMPNFFRVNS